MSLRLLAGSLLLGSFALMKGFMPFSALQTPEKQTIAPKWEYKALKLEANQCSYENQVATSLNSAGEEGWELISYERLSITFPKDAEGTLLIKPAATGPGREHTPQTADSFEGTMTMKMAPAQPGACRFLFKRLAPPPAKR
ncbi:MAG: hypothetical protein LAO78_19300 [Acidobacteriia bacterium]|nr:hypothetical protein [Terriglobia bacterium]